MTEPARDASIVDAQAEAAARALGGLTVGRELTADETAALCLVFKAGLHALREGFIARLAEQVRTEREAETVEEFFENIQPD